MLAGVRQRIIAIKQQIFFFFIIKQKKQRTQNFFKFESKNQYEKLNSLVRK